MIMKKPNNWCDYRIRGFTLVELMIAMLLGLMLIGGVIAAFIANSQVFRVNENIARIQESARIANELMGREIRGAGGNPCGTPLVANVLNNSSTAWWANWANGIVQGWDGNEAASFKGFGTAAADRVNGTDAILIISASAREGLTIVNHHPASAVIHLNKTDHGLSDDDIVMICDSFTAAILQITNIQGTTKALVHNTGSGVPGNCSKGLGYPTDCSTATGNSKGFTGGALVQMSAGFWYIGHNDRGGTSLYRLGMDGNPSITAEEMIEGVTDLQIDYLTRNGTTLASSYVAASGVSDWSDSATNLVVAARVTLTLQTLDAIGTDQQAVTRLVSFTSSLRNREQVQ